MTSLIDNNMATAQVATPPAHPIQSRPIGIFDSGVGGLSVLKALRLRQPALRAIYLADSGHAPYGDREPAHVIERSHRAAAHLQQLGASTIVVACNTATAWAIDTLRQAHPGMRFVGVEPGVKPATQITRNGRIAVMATGATLASSRFTTLVQAHAPNHTIIPVACTGLAAAIEQGLHNPEIDRLLDLYLEQVLAARADTLVLGCTHYPFVMDRILARTPVGMNMVDTADAVARHTLSALDQAAPPAAHKLRPATASGAEHIRLLTTGSAEVLSRLAHDGLGLATMVAAADL